MDNFAQNNKTDTGLFPHTELKQLFRDILLKTGFPESGAETIAGTFTENSLDGVLSHGVNRFPRFIKGYVKPEAKAVRKSSNGALEQWYGQL